MRLLDAVNFILPKLGEHKVTTVEAKHPTLDIILPEIEDKLTTILARGWWFNEFNGKLFPDSEGNIYIGTEVLSVLPRQSDTAVQRGNRMYNPVTFSYTFEQPIEARIRQRVEFPDLPEFCAKWVQYSALVSVYVTDIGETPEVSQWREDAEQAESDLLAEHLRQKKYNTKRSKQWQRLNSARRS